MVLLILAFSDLTTGQEVVDAYRSDDTTRMAAPEAKAGAVLWDQTHGVYLSYSLTGDFSGLRDTLINHGYSFDTTVNGVNNETLDNYRIVVLSIGSNWNSPYTSEEADSIVAYVNRGGSVLIQSENTGCPNSNLDAIVSRFNMSVGLGNPPSCIDTYTNNPTYSGMFTGVSSVCTNAPGEISASSPSEVIAWFGGSSPGVAAQCEPDHGGVVLVSDINLWDNTNLGNYDNHIFLINVFDWLSNPPCGPASQQERDDLAGNTTLMVKPNPTRSFLEITLPRGVEHAVMYNSLGAAVMQLSQGRVDVSGLQAGVYLIKAGEESRLVVIKK